MILHPREGRNIETDTIYTQLKDIYVTDLDRCWKEKNSSDFTTRTVLTLNISRKWEKNFSLQKFSFVT